MLEIDHSHKMKLIWEAANQETKEDKNYRWNIAG